MIDEIELHFKNGNLHHAYFLQNAIPAHRTSIETLIESVARMPLATNPDVTDIVIPVFGIDEARKVRTAYTTKAIAGKKRFFIIESSVFTDEAQNALLKTLEDPVTDAHMFILGVGTVPILETLASRLVVIANDTPEGVAALPPAVFLAANPKERLDALAPFLKKTDDDSKRAEQHRFAETLIEEIVEILSRRASQDAPERAALLEAAHALGYVRDRGSLPRLLLEHLALVLPVIRIPEKL